MQSFLQYRRIRKHLEQELKRHKNGLSDGAAASNDANRNPERGRDLHAYLAGDGVSREADLSDWHGSFRKHHASMTRNSPYKPQHRPIAIGEPASQEETYELEQREQEDEEADKDLVDDVQTGSDTIRDHASDTKAEDHDLDQGNLHSQLSQGQELGRSLTGINVRSRTSQEGRNNADVQNTPLFVVGFQGDDDPLNPHNFTQLRRWSATFLVALIGAVVGVASSIDSSALMQASQEFGVSQVVESLATGIYLIGFGTGALIAGPFSETFGRNIVYIVTLGLFCIFVMASGLAPNIGAQLAFRFLAGFFGATPLTCAGGSISDLWSPLERVYTFPIFAVSAFMGPIIGPVMGGWIAQSATDGIISWRWTEWTTLIMGGLTLLLVALFQPETYAGTILMWKAKHLRQLTGDSRYVAPMEIMQETFIQRIRRALSRPFLLLMEPIVMLIVLYLTIIYIILFTFFDGYNYIFAEIHGTSPGITGLCFLGIVTGLFLAILLVPLIYTWAKRELAKCREQGREEKLPPEFRLWFSMLGGAFAVPFSLFWLAWTSYSDISIWSPIAATVLFGYGILCIFITSYQYLIDAYETYSASALAAATLIRYVAAGGMVVVGIPFYENLGVHWTLTILGALAALMAPVPYIFYIYGAKIRKYSKYAPTEQD